MLDSRNASEARFTSAGGRSHRRLRLTVKPVFRGDAQASCWISSETNATDGGCAADDPGSAPRCPAASGPSRVLRRPTPMAFTRGRAGSPMLETTPRLGPNLSCLGEAFCSRTVELHSRPAAKPPTQPRCLWCQTRSRLKTPRTSERGGLTLAAGNSARGRQGTDPTRCQASAACLERRSGHLITHGCASPIAARRHGRATRLL
jgi:hypothetical protein